MKQNVIWQTQNWQDMLLASGQTQEYFVIETDAASFLPLGENCMRAEKQNLADAIGGVKIFVEKRKIALGQFGLFVIWYTGKVDDIQEHLQELCYEEKCVFAQIETLDYSLQPLSLYKGEDLGESWTGGFQTSYYKKFIPPYTTVIDLAQSEEEILTNMKPKGRYNIKLAEKKWVTVEQVDKNPYNAQIFFELMQETSSRDHFLWNTLQYYQNFLENITESQLLFAYFEGKVIAAGIFVVSDTTMLYYYGASSSAYRNVMAPYLLQWTAIQHAQKRGLILYDFLWIASPWDETSPLLGVTDFKLKFTPDVREVSRSFLFIEKKLLYTLIHFLKKIRRK